MAKSSSGEWMGRCLCIIHRRRSLGSLPPWAFMHSSAIDIGRHRFLLLGWAAESYGSLWQSRRLQPRWVPSVSKPATARAHVWGRDTNLVVSLITSDLGLLFMGLLVFSVSFCRQMSV